MAATARVIDLESFRARKNEQRAAVRRAPLVWVPVLVWFPMWRMVG